MLYFVQWAGKPEIYSNASTLQSFTDVYCRKPLVQGNDALLKTPFDMAGRD